MREVEIEANLSISPSVWLESNIDIRPSVMQSTSVALVLFRKEFGSFRFGVSAWDDGVRTLSGSAEDHDNARGRHSV